MQHLNDYPLVISTLHNHTIPIKICLQQVGTPTKHMSSILEAKAVDRTFKYYECTNQQAFLYSYYKYTLTPRT
eukprot:scaffold30697_cov28-Prasinocladus_malaysianus.AAC.1